MAAADRLSLGPEVRKLKLGDSFSKNGSKSFHTFRYDFKPASVDTKKVATVEIGPNNQATVTVPHVEGAGTAHTVFKGSRKPYTKECVLIIDHTTGEIVLEKLHSNVQLKKTRTEGTARRPVPGSTAPAQQQQPQQQQQQRPHTPLFEQQSTFGSSSKRTSPSRKQPHSPVQQQQQQQQQQRTSSSPSSPSISNLTAPSTSFKSLASSFVPSMPLLLDHDSDQTTSMAISEPSDATPEVGFLSDSSNDGSSSSGSSSGSSSDSSDDEGKEMKSGKKPTVPSEAAPPMISQQSSSSSFPSMPHFSQLTEDLHLSESGSDSDG